MPIVPLRPARRRSGWSGSWSRWSPGPAVLARTACQSTSRPRPWPPPQSPRSCRGPGTWRPGPSGATPAALMPAPQTTAAHPSALAAVRHARPQMANVSFTTVAVALHPGFHRRGVLGHLLRQVDVGQAGTVRRATHPSGPVPPVQLRRGLLDHGVEVSAVSSMPVTCASMPGPRRTRAASRPRPPGPTSVLLFPPSMASTAGRSAVTSAKAGTLFRAQGEGRQGVGGVSRRPVTERPGPRCPRRAAVLVLNGRSCPRCRRASRRPCPGPGSCPGRSARP